LFLLVGFDRVVPQELGEVSGDGAGALDVEEVAGAVDHAVEHPLRVPSKERPPNTELQRAPRLEAQVEIEIAAGDIARARAAADELAQVAARFESKALVAGATLARGRVRLAEGDAPGAEESFSQAVRLWNEVGAPYEAAVARLGLADAHRACGREDRAALEDKAARTILDEIETTPPAPAPEQPVVPTSVFRREDDYWLVVFEGHTVRVRDLKGMHYLERLLADPGREHHVLDLVAAESGTGVRVDGRVAGLPRSGLGDAGEILDPRAKEAYRRRLAEIEEDIDEARTSGDGERAAQAELERDFLVRELAHAFGLGGRERRAALASERARVAVTRAVRQAMARIEEHHPQLGEHLTRTIRTGTYCAYVPDPHGAAGWES
jgi:tetratricopeptide (TPR) repeat protein